MPKAPRRVFGNVLSDTPRHYPAFHRDMDRTRPTRDEGFSRRVGGNSRDRAWMEPLRRSSSLECANYSPTRAPGGPTGRGVAVWNTPEQIQFSELRTGSQRLLIYERFSQIQRKGAIATSSHRRT